eukprot:1954571-Rhodomonas_salina.1
MSRYAAMRCPALAYRMLLCAARYWPTICCYAISSTDIAYGARTNGGKNPEKVALLDFLKVSSYGLPTQCPVLT